MEERISVKYPILNVFQREILKDVLLKFCRFLDRLMDCCHVTELSGDLFRIHRRQNCCVMNHQSWEARRVTWPGWAACAWAVMSVGFSACTPRVEIAPSDKPITINMNIKIDHEVKVKVDRDLDEVINKDSKLF